MFNGGLSRQELLYYNGYKPSTSEGSSGHRGSLLHGLTFKNLLAMT